MTRDIIEGFEKEFTKLKRLADDARAQLTRPEQLFEKPANESNSIAVIMKHVGGNLISRWTGFLTTDGEKESRNRDSEFTIEPGEGEREIIARWDDGWRCLLGALSELTNEDLSTTITIRGEAMSAVQALSRSLAHTAYHTGQIVYLCRMHVEEGWKWLTIAPGGSAAFNEKMGHRIGAAKGTK